MKLAEALIERAELQKKNAQLLNRVTRNTMVQEGDAPAENPQELIAEYDVNMARFLFLAQKINETNNKTLFDNRDNVTGAIARRDYLGASIRAYRLIYESATIKQNRYSQTEVKYVRCVDAQELQDRINKLSKEYRELDTKLQGINWTVDLM